MDGAPCKLGSFGSPHQKSTHWRTFKPNNKALVIRDIPFMEKDIIDHMWAELKLVSSILIDCQKLNATLPGISLASKFVFLFFSSFVFHDCWGDEEAKIAVAVETFLSCDTSSKSCIWRQRSDCIHSAEKPLFLVYWKPRDAVICQRCGALPETDDPRSAYHKEGEKEPTHTHMEETYFLCQSVRKSIF